MKIKFGDMTVSQVKEICKEHKSCYNCPLYIKTYTDNMHKRCATHAPSPSPIYYITEIEIDLPDEENKDA